MAPEDAIDTTRVADDADVGRDAPDSGTSGADGNARSTTPPFRLTRHFSIASAAALVCVTVLITVLYRQSASDDLVSVAEYENVELARSISNSIWPEFGGYIQHAAKLDPATLADRRATRELGALLMQLTAGVNILKIKIYASNGITVFSTDPAEIGTDGSDNPGYRRANRDLEAASKLVHKGDVSAFSGKVFERDVVETYVPARPADGKSHGVLEIYSDVTMMTAGIERAANELVIALVASFVLLYGVLFLIVRRADGILRRQTAALSARDAIIGRAVGERKQLESRIEGAIESIQEAFAFFGADDRLVFCNEEYRRMHPLGRELIRPGVPFEEIIRTNVMRGNVADAVGREEAHIRERLERHRNPRGPIVRALSNGKTFLISERRTPDDGTCLTMVDITDIKRTEEALRLNESRLRGAVESLQEGFALYDADDRLIMFNPVYESWNPGVRKILENGGTFEDVTRANVARGAIPEADGREEAFVRQRLTQHRKPGRPILRHYANGRWAIIKETRTPEGGIAVTLSDVTGLMEIEEALRLSEDRMRGAVETLQEGFALYDAADRLVVCNDEYRRLHPKVEHILVPGMPFEDLVRANIAEGTNADAIGREEEHIRERLEQHRNPRGLIVRTLTNGTKFIIKEHRTPDGGIVVTETDVTDLKRAEEALGESRRALQTVIDTVPAMVNAKDAESRYIFMNRYQAELYGTTPEDAVGKTAGDFLGLGYGAYTRGIDLEILAANKARSNFEETWTDRDGDERVLLTTKVPLTGEDGVATHVVTVSLDITGRKRAEEALRESEQRLRAVIDSVPAIINVKDTDSRYLLVNRHHREYFGLGDADIVGKTSDLISPEHGKHARRIERAVVESGEPAPFYDARLRRSDGEEREHMVTKAPLRDLSNNIVGIVTACMDVTHRRELEEKAAAEHRRLLDAVESVDGGVILYDADDRMVLCNSTYRRNLHRIGHLLVPGTKFEDVIKGVVEAQIITVAPGGEAEYIKGRVARHRKLEPSVLHMKELDRWFLLREYQTSDGGTLIIRTDITDQKRTEEALRASEMRFRDLTDGSVMGIVIDRLGKPLFANQAYATIFGYDDPAEIMALDRLDPLYAPGDLARIRRHRVNRLKGRKAPERYEFEGVRKDGSSIRAESRFRVVTWEGEPAIQSTVIDITERHRAEAALKNSEERLRDIADAASDWFWEMGPDLRYTFVSSRFYEETGLRPKDVLGKTRLGFIGHRLVDKDEEIWRAYEDDIANRRPFRDLEYARKDPDGTIRYKRVNGKPFFAEDGAFLGYRGITADITDYRLAEMELSQHRKMESLGSLAGGIAHNLNNMLQPIVILSEMTRDRFPPDSRDHQNLDIICQASDNAKELVDRISTFSTEKDLRPKNIDIYETLREGMDLISPVVPSTIAVTENLDNKTGTVCADSAQTQTVLMNLVANAIDAMKVKGGSGELKISLTRDRVDETPGKAVRGLAPGDYAKFSVADTGHGMDEATMNRIFDPFFTTKKVGEGTGLGLSTAHGIIHRQNGAIRVLSMPGEGTVFDVYLPLVDGDSRPARK